MKKGSKAFNMKIKDQIRNIPLIAGVILFGLSAIFYMYALRLERLAVLYPLTALAYIWVAILSIKYLKERMNIYKWLGIILIIAGTAIIAYFSA